MPITNLKRYTPLKNKKYLFDANIWISIIGWEGLIASVNTNEVSSFFKNCINTQSTIILPSIIMSEIVNRIHRTEYAKYKQNVDKNCFYKDFRKTSESKKVIEDIQKILISQIVNFQKKNIVLLVDDNFESIDMSNAVNNLQTLDFNDYIILKICKKEDAFLVTNDSDFFSFQDEINILVASHK